MPRRGPVTSCRFVAGPLRGISALLLLRSVAAASLLAVADALGVQGAADDLVPDTGHLAQSRVRLLRRRRVDARAHAAALRALLERRRLVLRYLVLAALPDQLLDRGQPRLRLSRRFSC